MWYSTSNKGWFSSYFWITLPGWAIYGVWPAHKSSALFDNVNFSWRNILQFREQINTTPSLHILFGETRLLWLLFSINLSVQFEKKIIVHSMYQWDIHVSELGVNRTLACLSLFSVICWIRICRNKLAERAYEKIS